MHEGYARIGTVEIVNNARAVGIAESADCRLGWFEETCASLADALGDDLYSVDNLISAPWYDARVPMSERFYGVYGLGMRDIVGSTRVAEVFEGITEGGVVGDARRSGRTVRFRVFLSALGEDALEYGMSWLESALIQRQCITHDLSCGGSSLEFLVACPPERARVPELEGWEGGGEPPTRPQTDAEYGAVIDDLRRYLHGVSLISGPFEVETKESPDGKHWGRIVEFTLYAERPGIYGIPRVVALPPVTPQVFDDLSRNLIQVPSAELAETTTTVSVNYSLNPSLESSSTNWSAGAFGGDGPPGTQPVGALTSGRVVGERSYSGEASYQIRWLGNRSTNSVRASMLVGIEHRIAVPAEVIGLPATITIWGALIVAAGEAIQSTETLEGRYTFLNSSGAAIAGASGSMGAATGAERDGKLFSIAGLTVPAGAATVVLAVEAKWYAQSSSTPSLNRDVRLYADAAGLIRGGV